MFLRSRWLNCFCKCLVLCADSKKELDARAKELVKEATSPKKTTPQKTTTIRKTKNTKETKHKDSKETAGKSASRAKGKSGEKGPNKKKSSKKSQQKLAEIQRVQKEAEWIFRSTELEVS